jgi:hypothetical protein
MNAEMEKALALARKRVKRLPAGEEIVAQDVRGWCYEAGIEVGDDRHFGPLLKKLRDEGLLAANGVTTRGRSHGGWGTKWIKVGGL